MTGNPLRGVEKCIASAILLACGTITIIILAVLFMHSIKIEEERTCRAEITLKEVPCP
jgi:hypothetical protein